MFDSDLDENARKIQRRTFLTLSVGAIAGIALSHLRRPTVLAAAPAGVPGEVTIVEYSDDGKRLKKVRVAKVVKTEAEWKAHEAQWLPSEADRAFVASLMGRVAEPGKFANWIAPPARGINNQAVDFEYVRFG